MAWSKGRDVVVRLVECGDVDRIGGAAANGGYLLVEARLRLDSARLLGSSDPVSSFEISYEGVRHAATALLVQQGLRPTSRGGHRATCEVVVAQFGAHFDFFNRMRQIRNTLEYPRGPDVLRIQQPVLDRAHAYLAETVEKAEQLLPQLDMWQ